MSNLIPTPRADKHGVVVTRHMKPVSASSASASMPAPQIARASQRDLDWEAVNGLWEGNDGSRIIKALRALSDDDLRLLRSRLENGGEKFSDWVFRSFQIGKENCGIAMVECHEFFSACHGGAKFQLSRGMNAVYDVIGEEPLVRPSPFNVGNIKVAFLMKRLHIENDIVRYHSAHDYYRDIELLRANLESIEPALPFISMVANAIPENPFNDASAVVEAAARFVSVPEDRFADIHAMLSTRCSTFDADLVDQVMENKTRALYDGLL